MEDLLHEMIEWGKKGGRKTREHNRFPRYYVQVMTTLISRLPYSNTQVDLVANNYYTINFVLNVMFKCKQINISQIWIFESCIICF